ncbi:hypothetical protein [Nocardiopsis sp. HUAS JQ3]|uniref:hypothetical protein n=1 Tax=Nocardiopsis sp. HUAS JQ3 TaxID=3061629 RepID=UPI0023A99FF0|nr:hypothetical protein [Nocardiopsis sp. HUAS JQ3]WDZ92947.1 hypothetical protein PV789_10635 [Nocardiopsis sp. HUAS JQ3]
MESMEKLFDSLWLDHGRYHFHETTGFKDWTGSGDKKVDRWWKHGETHTSYFTAGYTSYSYDYTGYDYAGYNMQKEVWGADGKGNNENEGGDQVAFRQSLNDLSALADYATNKLTSKNWDLERLQATIDHLDDFRDAVKPYIDGEGGGVLNKLWQAIDTPDGPMRGSAAAAYKYRLQDMAYRMNHFYEAIPNLRAGLKRISDDLKSPTADLADKVQEALTTRGGQVGDAVDDWYFQLSAGSEKWVDHRNQFDILIVPAGENEDGTERGEVRGIVGDPDTDTNVNNALYQRFRDHYKTVHEYANGLYDKMETTYDSVKSDLKPVAAPTPLPTQTPDPPGDGPGGDDGLDDYLKELFGDGEGDGEGDGGPDDGLDDYLKELFGDGEDDGDGGPDDINLDDLFGDGEDGPGDEEEGPGSGGDGTGDGEDGPEHVDLNEVFDELGIDPPSNEQELNGPDGTSGGGPGDGLNPPPPVNHALNGPGDGLGDNGGPSPYVPSPPSVPPPLGLNGPGDGLGNNGLVTPPPVPPPLGLNGPGDGLGDNGPLIPPPMPVPPPPLGLNGPGSGRGGPEGYNGSLERDPATGLPLNPETGQPFPVDPETGLPYNPENDLPINYDPETGQVLPIDPVTGQPVPDGGTGSSLEFDPATGLPLDPETGQPFPVDPETGLPYNPENDLPINYDPETGQVLPIDPVTGQPVGIDPETGLPNDYGYNVPTPPPDLGLNGPGTGQDGYDYGNVVPTPPPDLGLNGPGTGEDVPINPVTGEPYVIDPITGQPYPIDPETGAPITNGFDGLGPSQPRPSELPPLESPNDLGLNYGGLSPGPGPYDSPGTPDSSDRSSLFANPDGTQYQAGGPNGASGGQGNPGALGGVGGAGGLNGQPGAGGAGAGGMGGMGGMPMMPPMMGGMGGGMGGGGGDNNRDRQRSTWLSEDEKVWGTTADGQKSALGRPVLGQNKKGTPRHELADAAPDGRGTGTASQDDGPTGGRKRKSGGGNRRGRGQEQARGREGERDG